MTHWILALGLVGSVPPGFDLAKYQQMIALAGQKGQPMQADEYEYRVLTHMTPTDTSKPHQADYFSGVGGVNSAGVFVSVEVSMESETWTIDSAGHWNIEEWNWTASVTGELEEVDHTLVVETLDGDVLDVKGLPHGTETDAAELARWNAKLTDWYGY